MRAIVIAEHADGALRAGSLSALGFAQELLQAEGGGEAVWLVAGSGVEGVAKEAARFAPVRTVDAPVLESVTADAWAGAIASAVEKLECELVVAASTTFAKDVVARAAGLLGGAMASDVTALDSRDGETVFRRPMFAGSITATVRLCGKPRVVTVRPAAFEAASELDNAASIEPAGIDTGSLSSGITVEGLSSKATDRPDLTEARVVVSGGRAFKSTEDFEKHVGALADALGGAAGSSRALVDSGITPNELQVGQTGKVVAPELYIALGLSGAVQHLAGMKSSRCIVAVNKDPEAPIFEVADYGLVGDVFQVVPALLEKLKGS